MKSLVYKKIPPLNQSMANKTSQGVRMLKMGMLLGMVLFSQANVAQALDKNLSSEASLAISQILKANGVDEKRLILLSNPGEKEEEEEEIINAKFSGICCKRWIYGKGFVVQCVPYRGLVANEAFRKSCSDMGGDERMFVGADEEQMRSKYGVDILFHP